MARISLATDGLRLERLPVQASRLVVEPRRRPLTGRTVLVVGLGQRTDSAGIASGTLDIAEHLAVSAASVTLLTGFTRPNGRRRRAPRVERAASRPAPSVVHLDHRVGRAGEGPTPVTRAAEAATRLALAASGALPAPPDLVIATSPGLGGAIAGARLARRHRAPLILLVHDLLAASDGYGPVGAAVERHALASADQVLVTSDAFREPIAGYGIDPQRIRHLPSWAGADRSVLGRAEARAVLRWPAAGLVVLAVDVGGTPAITGSGSGAHGPTDPSWTAVTTRRLAERTDVRLVSADDVPAAGLPHAVAAADLLVLTDERGAATPGEVATWLAAGRPIVTLAPRGSRLARAVARSSGAGVCIRPGDEDGLADAIAGLTARPSLLALMGERARRFACSSPDRVAAMRVVDSVVDVALAPDL